MEFSMYLLDISTSMNQEPGAALGPYLCRVLSERRASPTSPGRVRKGQKKMVEKPPPFLSHRKTSATKTNHHNDNDNNKITMMAARYTGTSAPNNSIQSTPR